MLIITKTTQVHVGATGYMSVNDRPSMGQPYNRGQSFTDWLWSSQAKTTPVSYPLRYSNGRLPAVAEKDEISPYVLLNYTGSTKEQKIAIWFLWESIKTCHDYERTDGEIASFVGYARIAWRKPE